MSDPDESDHPDFIPDSITITITLEDLRCLLAETRTNKPVAECRAILALVWRAVLLALPPLARGGVERWVDELVRRRWQ